MEVKAGYKMTEVGVIPEDWEVGCLSRYWTVTDCKHVTARFIVNGHLIASIKEVQSRFINLTNAKQTTLQFYNLLIEGGRKPRVGDLIMSRNATVGEVAQVAKWHPPFAMGQDVCLLRKKTQEFSTDYLQSVFRSSIIANQLSDLMVGSTFKRANVQQIKNFIVPMPSPPEQQAIAETLSDVDALIESFEQLIAKKRNIKQGAMQELLTGKRRLPGFSGEWEVKRLGEVAEIIMGQSPSSTHYNNKGVGLPLIQGNADISNRMAIKRVFTAVVTKRGRCGDILMSVRAPVGEISRAVFDVCLGRGVCAIRYSNDYLYHALIAKEPAWATLSKGSTFDSVNSTDVNAFIIKLPKDESEQTAIAAILTDMDTEIAALKTKLAKAHKVKQGMMQELLTGRIRLV